MKRPEDVHLTRHHKLPKQTSNHRNVNRLWAIDPRPVVRRPEPVITLIDRKPQNDL
jgi:hypothetical protein